MIVYLASPNTQQQSEHVAGMPVLLSFACWGSWLDKGYWQSFSRILIDSGAYSEFNTGKAIDLAMYRDWAAMWGEQADAIAGRDNISGDWRQSLKNYEAFPGGFPTFHETDPPELLPRLVAMSKERKQWLGIGLLPPRQGKEVWVRRTLDSIPEDIHVHGWACRAYMHCRRFNSVDSTNWWRDGMMLRKKLPWLTYGECLEIIVKRYQRERRILSRGEQLTLFPNEEIE